MPSFKSSNRILDNVELIPLIHVENPSCTQPLNFDVWDKESILFILCFGFLDFELLKTMNLFDWFSICFVLAIEELILHLLSN
jgi:hypothetical protein